MSEKHIFISYSRNDGEPYVSELEQRLGAHHRVWRDIRGLRPDQDFTADIERAIEAASHVVVCLTPDTKRDNSFVRREIQYALAIKRPVIPVRCVDIPPHVSIINNEWVDYFRDADAAITRLLEIVSNSDYANKPSGNTAAPFREYLESALKFIVDGLDQRIIRLIDLKAAPKPDAVNFRPPQERASIFKQAFSGVKKSEPEKPPQIFDTFQAGFKLYGERALLLGQPGAGKTITLMAHARDAYAARLADPTQPLPLFGLVPTWNPKDKPPLSDWLAESLSIDPQLLRSEIDAGHTLLLLDGLDELRAVDDDSAVGAQYIAPTPEKIDPRRAFLDALPANNRILLTCRIEDYDEIGQKANLNGAITLRDLTAEQVQIYLAEQPHLLKLIESDDQLRELTQTPLLLSIFAFAYQDMTDAEREQLAKIDSAGELRDKIFMRYIDQRYEHEAAKVSVDLPLTLEELKEALGNLAMWNASGWGFTDDQGNEYNVRPNIMESAWIEAHKIIVNPYITFPFAEELRLLVRDDSENYRFAHLLLRDTLAFSHAVHALGNPIADLRRIAVSALKDIKDPRAVEPIISILYDPDDNVRSSAFSALGEIKDPRAIEPLISALQDPNHLVRLDAASALVAIKDPRAVEPLIICLKDPDYIIRSAAVSYLGIIEDPRAIEPLIICLKDPDFHDSAALSLMRFEDMRVVEPLTTYLSDPDSDQDLHYAITFHLERTKLINALSDPDPNIRATAAHALGELRSNSAVEPLINALSDPENYVRERVTFALGELNDLRAVEPLINALNNPDAYVRSSAADNLGELNDLRAVQPLINALGDLDSFVRSSAAHNLGKLNDLRAVQPLINALNDSASHVEESATLALSKFHDPRVVEPLINALKSPRHYIRSSAAEALGQLNDARAVYPLLNTCAYDPELYVMLGASLAIDQLGSTAVEPLIKALQDPDENIRKSANTSLWHIHTAEATAAVEAFRRGEIQPRSIPLEPPDGANIAQFSEIKPHQPKKWWQFWRHD